MIYSKGPMNRRRFLMSAAAGTAAAAAASIPFGASAASFSLRYISMHNPSSFWAKFFFELQKQARERSNGELQINWAGGPEVLPPFQAPDAISKGVFDMCLSTPGFYANALPEAIGLQVVRASLGGLRESGSIQLMDEIHRAKMGLAMIGLPSTGVGYTILTTRPVKSLAELKGRRIRAIALYVPMLRALGAATVTVTPAETYTALERGVVDGVAWPLVGIAEFRYHEVAKNMLLPPYYHSLVNHLVNAKKLDSMPGDLRKVLMDASRATDEWGVDFTRQLAADELAVMKKVGLTENALPPEDAKRFSSVAVEELWKKVIADSPVNGPRIREAVTKAASIT